MTEEKTDYTLQETPTAKDLREMRQAYHIAVKSRDEMRRSYIVVREQNDLLTGRLARAEQLLERAPGALNAAFSGGTEEREGGSGRRQERYMKEPEALASEIRAFLDNPDA